MNKFFTLLSIVALIAFTSCNAVRVTNDYDTQANFNEYKTFAFFKPGIDQAEISDLDKKRILRSIEAELSTQGMIKSEDPDLLVSFFTEERENVNVYNNNFGWGGWGWGWGWNPWWGMGGTNVTTTTEGSLIIDLIDAENKELVWQGVGNARLYVEDIAKKQERINLIVKEILATYPPGREDN
ncbi:DUF4136 domain-containing protein [Gangjinia marincola]|uniref:DUF4136 domain-containing protein n=1 Tax=Gangjinia marincola TaxID=578463 RepID=A0ABP3XU31_9FLAO